MLPFRHVGTAKTEQWLGLVDAVYAIAMTVLALILPDILSDCIKLFRQTGSTQYAWVGVYFIAFYFLGFIIIYETWCFHRCILNALPCKSRRQNIYTSLLLGIICLMPPLTAATFKDIEVAHYWQKLTAPEIIDSLGLLLWALAFLLLNLIARDSKKTEAWPALRLISKAAGQRSLFFAILFLYHVIEAHAVPQLPHIPIVLIMFIYILISFNQDKLTGVLQRQ